MNDFVKAGWLARSIESELAFSEQSWWKLAKKVEELSRSAWCLQIELECDKRDIKQLLAATLFARVVSLSQAFLLLAPKGMKSELMVLMRCALEPFFPLGAISKDENFAMQFIKSEEHERLKKFKNLAKLNEITPVDA